jgi:hypothetical protein
MQGAHDILLAPSKDGPKCLAPSLTKKESTTFAFYLPTGKMRHSCQKDELTITCVHAAKQFHLSPDLPVTAVVAPVDHVPTPIKLGETSPRSRSGDRRPFLDGMKDWKPLWPVIFWTCRFG